jgi:hypothetical protein
MVGKLTMADVASFSRRWMLALGLALVAAMSSVADTPGMLRRAGSARCPCVCGESRAHAGCTKMCETGRRASRRAAVTCIKPRIKIPAETPGAGPRFPRPGRAERASR